MPSTTNINGLSCVHQSSGGVATATLPDVCKTPPYTTPVPYPNIALAADLVGGTVTIAVDGSPAAVQSSMFVKSTGDEPGALGGVVSQVFMMEATFLSFSPTVLFEGQPACRLTDKMLMNKANTVCMNGVIQAPLAPVNTAPPDAVMSLDPEQPVFCSVQEITLACGHAERGFLVDLIKHDTPTLQVISGETDPDKILVSWVATCPYGNPKCPSMLVAQRPHGMWKAIDPAKNLLELPAPTFTGLTLGDVVANIERLIGWRDKLNDSYILQAMICNGGSRANLGIGVFTEVQVFPEMEFKGEMSFGYEQSKAEDKPGKDAGSILNYDRKAVWKFGGSIEGKIGAHTVKYELGSDTKGDALPIFASLIDKVGRTTLIFETMKRYGADFKGEIRWPSWKHTVGLELAELPGKPTVGPKGKIGIAFDPLIGLEFKVSLLDYLIRFAGTLAPGAGFLLAEALITIKNKFAKYSEDKPGAPKALVKGSLEIEIDLVVTGDILGNFTVTFSDGKSDIGDSLIEGRIGVQIEGRIIGKAKIWKVEFAAGGKVGAAAAKGDGSSPSRFGARLKPKEENKRLKATGELYFTGLAFYYLIYAQVGSAGAETEKKADDDEDVPKTSSMFSMQKRVEKKGSAVLLKPWVWPDAPGT
jgi:hypothetical protein